MCAMSTEQQSAPESTTENETASEQTTGTSSGGSQSTSSTRRKRSSVQLKGKAFDEQLDALRPDTHPGFDQQAAMLSPNATVQLKGTGVQKKDIHDLAAQGTQGGGGSLPHLDTIQSAFGRHDVSGVQAHTGSAAQAASAAMGAEAYASGNSVAFGGSPSLHTAAHEAAHIVQQRGGVSLDGGVGKAGDSYENHADAVADAVVSGKSAEGLLDQMSGGGKSSAIQNKNIQKQEVEPESEPARAVVVQELPPGFTEEQATAAVQWGGSQGYAADAIRSLQEALSCEQTGVYDRATAIAVFTVQSSSTRRSMPGKADRMFFMQKGAIAYKDQPIATAGDGILANIKRLHPSGINLGVATNYTKRSGNNIEITRKANDWGTSFNGVGISGGTLAIGVVTHITVMEEVVQAVRSVHEALVAAHQQENPQDTEIPEYCKIKNLAVFSHGMEYGVSLDASGTYSRGLHNNERHGRESNVKAFVQGVSGALVNDVNVQLFACNTALDLEVKREKGDRSGYHEWVDHDEGERRGEGSFADLLNQGLEEEGHDSSVYGHTTAGHATENFAARVYGQAGQEVGPEAAEGEDKAGSPHMFDVLYGEAFLLRQLVDLGVKRAEVSYAAVRGHASSSTVADKVREIAWKHYKDSISSEHKRSSRDKRYAQPIGRLMFMDQDAAKTLLHNDFATWAQTRLGAIVVPEDAKSIPAPSPHDDMPVHRKESTPHAPTGPGVQAAAAEGVAGAGGQLPHLDTIQASFGKHDVTGVQSHTGGAARDAASQIGAKAYATGNDVAFGQSPDLHTAAHEAAHIVQQRAGVSLKGGVGQAGDKYEQHADAVADAVVQGKSAESLLDTMAGSGKSEAVQSKAVQKRRRETDEQYEKRRARERKERKAKREKSQKFREKLGEESFQSVAMATMDRSIKVSEIKKYFGVSSAWALGSKEIWQQLENSEATRVIGYCQRKLAGNSAKKMARIFSKHNGSGQWDAEFRDSILAYYDVVAAADPLRAAIKKNRNKIQKLKATQPIWLHFIRENTNRVNKMSFIKNGHLIVYLLNQAKRAVTILPKLIDKDINRGSRMQTLLENEIGNVFYAIELTRIAEKLDLKNLSSVIMAQIAVGTLKSHIGAMHSRHGRKIAMPPEIRDGQGREKRSWRSAWNTFVDDVENYHNAKYFSSLTSVANTRAATITTLADVLESGAGAARAVEGVLDAPMDFGPHHVGIYRNARSPKLSDPWVGTTGWVEDLGQAFTPYHKQITIQAYADLWDADSGEDLAADYVGKTGLEQRAMKEQTSSGRSGSKSRQYRDTMHDIKKVNRTVNWPELQGWLINQFDTLDSYLATRIDSYKRFKKDASWWHVIMPPNWDLGDLIKNFRRVRKQLPQLKRKARRINDKASANSVFALFMKLQRNINAADMEVKKWSNSAVEFAQDAIMVSNILIDVGTAVLTTTFPPAAAAISTGVSVLKDVGTQIVADGNWKPAEMATNAGKSFLSGKLKRGLKDKFPLSPTGAGRMGKVQNFLEEVFYNQMLDTLVAPLTDSSGAFLLALYNKGDVGHALDEAGNAAHERINSIWSAEGIVRQMAVTGTKQIVRSRMKAELQASMPELQWNEAEINQYLMQIEDRLSSYANQ